MMHFSNKLVWELYSTCLLLCCFLVFGSPSYEDPYSIVSSSQPSFPGFIKRGDPVFELSRKPEDKRALSLFGYWKPYNLPNVLTKSQVVTRGGTYTRPLGQPLRWG